MKRIGHWIFLLLSSVCVKSFENTTGCLFVWQENERRVFCLSPMGWIVSIGWAEEELGPFKFCAKIWSACDTYHDPANKESGIGKFSSADRSEWRKRRKTKQKVTNGRGKSHENFRLTNWLCWTTNSRSAKSGKLVSLMQFTLTCPKTMQKHETLSMFQEQNVLEQKLFWKIFALEKKFRSKIKAFPYRTGSLVPILANSARILAVENSRKQQNNVIRLKKSNQTKFFQKISKFKFFS